VKNGVRVKGIRDQAMTSVEDMVETNMVKEEETAARAIPMIRQGSKPGQLISESDIIRRLADQHLINSQAADPGEVVGIILKKVVDGSEDLHELAAPDGSRSYNSSHFMTEPYAKLLLPKQGDCLQLIAEIVRRNSEVPPARTPGYIHPATFRPYPSRSPGPSGIYGSRRGVSGYRAGRNINVKGVSLF